MKVNGRLKKTWFAANVGGLFLKTKLLFLWRAEGGGGNSTTPKKLTSRQPMSLEHI